MRHFSREKEQKNWKRRTRHNESRKDKKYNPRSSEIKVHRVLGWEHISVPPHLDLYNEDTRESTLEFLELVEKYAFERKVSLDCSEAESVSAAALLLLYATIDTLKNDENAKLVRFQNLKGRFKFAIERSGLKGVTLNKETPLDEGQNGPIPIIRGTSRGEEFEAVIDYVQHQIFENDMTPEEENIWAAAVMETVSNVKLHAYRGDSDKPWWIICSVIDDNLYLAICDRGVGIPNTIKEQNWVKSIVEKTPSLVQKLLSESDSDAIELSMMVGETSTKQDKHGLGSKSIQALVDENPDGALWVFSNRGVYYRENHDTELKDFSLSISGTLVQWNIKLKNGSHEDNRSS
ncbi:hypothetical protein O7R09_07665 [Vibrio alginolyticus]|uniref:ATP-binding protein n=1 Tax=Vibrio alginolyticus TaxID=663 RepID=UPI0022DE866E|nr:hypothetical protein [Vibrio alginolyticus]MDA0420644.1 hypothetical protein [Vibrio alginolyticus]